MEQTNETTLYVITPELVEELAERFSWYQESDAMKYSIHGDFPRRMGLATRLKAVFDMMDMEGLFPIVVESPIPNGPQFDQDALQSLSALIVEPKGGLVQNGARNAMLVPLNKLRKQAGLPELVPFQVG